MNEEPSIVRHPSMWRNRPILFAILILAVPFTFGATLLILLAWWINCLGTTITVTDDRTRLRKGILSKKVTEVWHTDVRNVAVQQSILNRLFGVGTVAISSSGQSGFEIAVNGIASPYDVKNIIDEHRRATKK